MLHLQGVWQNCTKKVSIQEKWFAKGICIRSSNNSLGMRKNNCPEVHKWFFLQRSWFVTLIALNSWSNLSSFEVNFGFLKFYFANFVNPLSIEEISLKQTLLNSRFLPCNLPRLSSCYMIFAWLNCYLPWYIKLRFFKIITLDCFGDIHKLLSQKGVGSWSTKCQLISTFREKMWT